MGQGRERDNEQSRLKRTKQNEQAMIIDGHEEARASRELRYEGRNTADVGLQAGYVLS